LDCASPQALFIPAIRACFKIPHAPILLVLVLVLVLGFSQDFDDEAASSRFSLPHDLILMPTFAHLLLLLSLTASSFAAPRPNILWLIAEDFGPHLSCCGTKEVWTPNLDALARAGVRYTRFYAGMVCSPSRSAFMTGMYATTIGAHNHRSHRDDGYQLPQSVRVLTDWLRDAGYFTANLVQLPESCGFKGTGKIDWNFSYKGKPFDSANWDDLKTHQPFYAQINFQETHRGYHAPKRADPAKVQIPPYYPDHPITRRDWANYLDAATELDRKIGLVLHQLEQDGLADNTVIVFFGDNGQSHVRGKQFCYEEGLNVPLIIRWPKALPPPAKFKPGSLDHRLIESIDLAPTMLDFAGASKPPKMEGRIFLGARCEPAREYVFGARDRCDETVMRIRAVRDERYRYIRNFTPGTPFLAPNEYKQRQYPVLRLLKELHAQGKLTPAQDFLCQPRMPDEELYDLKSDPDEIHNLSASTKPAHQAELKKLRAVLEQWIEQTQDQGRVFEPPAVAAAKGATKPPP
jgi:arylsulfatase A-like enzyme